MSGPGAAIHSPIVARSAINRFRGGRTISAGVMRLPAHPIGCSTQPGADLKERT